MSKPSGPKGYQPDDPAIQELLKALRLGHYVQDAAIHAGINSRTVYSWLRETDEIEDALTEGETPTPAQQRVLQIGRSIKEARLAAQTRNIQAIQQAATGGTWQAAAWFLERSQPDKWGRFQRIAQEISGPGGDPIQVETASRQSVLDLLGIPQEGDPE